MTYISVYNAWYCYPCQKYAPPKPGQQYRYPEGYQASATGASAAAPDGTAAAGAAQSASEALSSANPAGAAAREATRTAPNKCTTCGAPIPASGECANCRSKELLAGLDTRMEEATAAGIDVRKVDALVRQAKNSLDDGNFGESKLTAEKAVALMEETSANFTKAKEQIAEAQKVVDEFRKRSVDVGQSDSLIQLAQSFLKTGNYEKAVAYAKKAIKTANEAQTRQATEKALGDKPPLPPAVAKPVDSGPLSDQKAGAISRPVILAVPKTQAAAASPGVCPTCGEAVEPSWKRCPGCTTPLGGAAAAAADSPAKADKGPEPAATAAGDQSSEVEAAAAEQEIREVEKTLEKMEKDGLNVAHARNLLKLAVSFLRGGSYEKATRYARKVKNVLEEKKGG